MRRIAFIVFVQRIRLTLKKAGAELGKLPADRIPTRGDWARLSGGWTKRIDQRIVELQRIKNGLTQCIADAFTSTNANWQIPPIEPDAEGSVRGTGLVDPRFEGAPHY